MEGCCAGIGFGTNAVCWWTCKVRKPQVSSCRRVQWRQAWPASAPAIPPTHNNQHILLPGVNKGPLHRHSPHLLCSMPLPLSCLPDPSGSGRAGRSAQPARRWHVVPAIHPQQHCGIGHLTQSQRRGRVHTACSQQPQCEPATCDCSGCLCSHPQPELELGGGQDVQGLAAQLQEGCKTCRQWGPLKPSWPAARMYRGLLHSSRKAAAPVGNLELPDCRHSWSLQAALTMQQCHAVLIVQMAGSAVGDRTHPRLQHGAWSARLACCCRAGGLQTNIPLKAGHGMDMQ